MVGRKATGVPDGLLVAIRGRSLFSAEVLSLLSLDLGMDQFCWLEESCNL